MRLQRSNIQDHRMTQQTFTTETDNSVTLKCQRTRSIKQINGRKWLSGKYISSPITSMKIPYRQNKKLKRDISCPMGPNTLYICHIKEVIVTIVMEIITTSLWMTLTTKLYIHCTYIHKIYIKRPSPLHIKDLFNIMEINIFGRTMSRSSTVFLANNMNCPTHPGAEHSKPDLPSTMLYLLWPGPHQRKLPHLGV